MKEEGNADYYPVEHVTILYTFQNIRH